MIGVRRLLEHLAEDTSEALADVYAQLDKLEAQHREDTLMILVLYEALLTATSQPGSLFAAFKDARDILALAGEISGETVAALAAEAGE